MMDIAVTVVFVALLALACYPTSTLKGHLRFRARRERNWFLLGLLYACYYLCRHNLTFANKSICDEFGFTREQFGWIQTSFLWAYAVGQFINGFITDHIGGKRAMLWGAIGTVILNIVFGAASMWGMLSAFIAIRLLDGYMQSMGAPGMVKMNTAWFSRPERGGFAGIFGFMIQMGQVGIQRYIGPALLAGSFWFLSFEPLHWRYLFWVPALITAVVAVVMALMVKSTPEEAGFQPVSEDENGKVYYGHRGEACPHCGTMPRAGAGSQEVEEDAQLAARTPPTQPGPVICAHCGARFGVVGSAPADASGPYPRDAADAQLLEYAIVRPPMGTLLRTILSHPGVWFCAVAYFCTGFVRYGVLNWWIRWFQDFGVEVDTTLYKSTAFWVAMVAVVGSLGAGYASDLIFKGRRAPVAACLYLIETAIILAAAYFVSNIHGAIERGDYREVKETIAAENAQGKPRTVVDFYDRSGVRHDVVPGMFWAVTFVVLIALTCNSTHSILGTAAAMDIGGRQMSGFAAGVIDSFQYFGAGLTGFFVGGLIDDYGYTVWLLSMAPVGLIGCVCMLTYRIVEKRAVAANHQAAAGSATPS